ncbi:hypothetical protein V8F33_005341 [Rhypophila sp. PSN 637]
MGVLDIVKQTELPFWVRDPVFSHLHYTRSQSLQQQQQREEEGDMATVTVDGNKAAGPTMTQIMALLRGDEEVVVDEDKVLQQVLKVLAQRLARALMIPADEVDTVKSPANLGADSLVAIEIRNSLAREAGIEMPEFDILQAPSLAAMADNVLKDAEAKL